MELSLSEMQSYAADFVARLPKHAGTKAHAVGLKGDLGAGKTTFVQAVAKELGVQEHVTSPTFVLVQVYETKHPVFTRLVHMDAYRLSSETRDTIGFAEYFNDPRNLILIEWPEYLPRGAGFPTDASTLRFETIDATTRRISGKTEFD